MTEIKELGVYDIENLTGYRNHIGAVYLGKLETHTFITSEGEFLSIILLEDYTITESVVNTDFRNRMKELGMVYLEGFVINKKIQKLLNKKEELQNEYNLNVALATEERIKHKIAHEAEDEMGSLIKNNAIFAGKFNV